MYAAANYQTVESLAKVLKAAGAVLGILIGIVAISVAAGIGVVGFFALICALVVVAWYLIEAGLTMARRKSRR